MNRQLRLPADRCHLWITNPESIADREILAAYAALMAPEEIERHSRLRFARHRHRFLVTRALVRTTLSRYAPVAPEEWVFGRGVHGRPFIEGPGEHYGLSFNVSHTAGMIVCLVARRTVGVDVENIAREVRALRLAGRFFSPSEVADLERFVGTPQRRRFFEYWTLKESYLKALGKGLSLPLDKITFRLAAGRPIRARLTGSHRDYATSWQFWQAQLGPDHLVAASLHTGDGLQLGIDTASVVPQIDDTVVPTASP